MENFMFKSMKSFSQKLGAMKESLTVEMVRPFLFTFGVLLLVGSVSDVALATPGFTPNAGADTKLRQVIELVLYFVEGPFGALIMVTAGLGAIVAAAMGSYKAALGLFVVGVGAFILRSLVKIFFGNSVNATGTVVQ